MLGVAVGALRRRPVGAHEDISVRVKPADLPEMGLAEDLEAQGEMTNLGDDGVFVALRIEAVISRECARCLRPVKLPLQADAEETFQSEGPPPSIVEDTADVEAVISEAVLLAEPMRVLCAPECRGLCPQCGKDLNEGPCGCVVDETDARLKPLEKLLHPREEKR